MAALPLSALPSPNKLEGKVAIITGGASGIGETTAHLFSDHGARAIVIADIQDEKGQAVVDSIGSHKAVYIKCDVTNENQVKSTVDKTVEIYGRLDIMFSNAGILNSLEQSILDLDLELYDRCLAINARGMAACVKHTARAMVYLGVRGSIVCTASAAGSNGRKSIIDYCMSKHAVVGLMRSASQQLGGYGIRVNCVSPYVVATPLICRASGKEAEEVEKFYGDLPHLKGITLKTKHVADAVLFLASDDSVFISGHDLLVDGALST